jgi:hypothetical protein
MGWLRHCAGRPREFGLPHEHQLRDDLRKLVQVARLFLFFHKPLCDPLLVAVSITALLTLVPSLARFLSKNPPGWKSDVKNDFLCEPTPRTPSTASPARVISMEADHRRTRDAGSLTGARDKLVDRG